MCYRSVTEMEILCACPQLTPALHLDHPDKSDALIMAASGEEDVTDVKDVKGIEA